MSHLGANQVVRAIMTALLTWRRSARSSGCALRALDVVAFGHHDVVIVVSGNSAGREAIGERSELFGEIGWCFHHFFPSVSCIMNVVADIECVTHAVDLLGPPAQIRPPIPL